MMLAPVKKVILRFFPQLDVICLCAKFEVSLTPATGFLPIDATFFGKYVMRIFFLQYLNSCPPARTGIIRFGSKLTKN